MLAGRRRRPGRAGRQRDRAGEPGRADPVSPRGPARRRSRGVLRVHLGRGQVVPRRAGNPHGRRHPQGTRTARSLNCQLGESGANRFMNAASGTPRSLRGHRHTIRSMTEEWRVSLVIYDDGSLFRRSRFRDLLRSRLGDDVAVSVGQTGIFLYTGSAKAADEAGQMARALLEEQGRRITETRLERWDPAGGEWRDPEEAADHEGAPTPGPPESKVISFIKGAGLALQYSDPFPPP